VAIFGTVKTQPNNVTIEKLNDAARSYFLMDAILKPAHTLDGRNREKLSNAIEIILEYLENFDPRWGIVYDKVLFSRLIHDLKLFYDGLPIRPQRINRQCRPEEKGRYLFINRLAGIYHDITQKAARKPGKWIQPEKDKGSVS